MNRTFKVAIVVLLFLAIIAGIGLYMVSHNIPVLEPKGMIAVKQRNLLITASLLMLIVVVPTLILTLVFAWKYREGSKGEKYTPNWDHSPIAEIFWWGIPCLIIIGLSVMTWQSTHELNPFKPIESDKKAITIQAVALQWKWLFIYPEQGIATVNFVQFPEQTPINFEITADAPMNSFWIPALGGQIYAMPAMRTKLYLIASEVGTYRGASANISGSGFAGMAFKAHSMTDADFESWVASVKQSGQPLGSSEYDQLVAPSEYNPIASYVLTQENLFDQILMKYMPMHESK